MTRNLFCLATASIAFAVVGCTAATAPATSTAAPRIIKANTDQSGKPNFVYTDVAVNAVVTCADAHGDTLCVVRQPGGLGIQLKKGESLTVTTAGKLTFSCNGSGPEFCEASIKD